MCHCQTATPHIHTHTHTHFIYRHLHPSPLSCFSSSFTHQLRCHHSAFKQDSAHRGSVTHEWALRHTHFIPVNTLFHFHFLLIPPAEKRLQIKPRLWDHREQQRRWKAAMDEFCAPGLSWQGLSVSLSLNYLHSGHQRFIFFYLYSTQMFYKSIWSVKSKTHSHQVVYILRKTNKGFNF